MRPTRRGLDCGGHVGSLAASERAFGRQLLTHARLSLTALGRGTDFRRPLLDLFEQGLDPLMEVTAEGFAHRSYRR